MRIFICLLYLILLASCSRTGVVFRFADSVIVSKADDYLDLDGPQQDLLKKNLKKDLTQIKSQTVPEIAKTLREIEVQSRSEELNKAQLNTLTDQLRAQVISGGAFFQDSVIETANSLSQSQYSHLKKEAEKDIEKKRDEFKKDPVKQTAKRQTKAIEFWVGTINKRQKELVQDFAKAHPFPWQLREKNQRSLLEKFLNTQDKKTERENLIKEYLTNYENLQSPELKVAMTDYHQNLKNFYIDKLWPSLSDSQKKNLRQNLLKRAEDLEAVAQRP